MDVQQVQVRRVTMPMVKPSFDVDTICDEAINDRLGQNKILDFLLRDIEPNYVPADASNDYRTQQLLNIELEQEGD